jgi:nitroreductase
VFFLYQNETLVTFNDVITQRYSCRSFSPQSIAQEKIDRILAAGRIAPTAVNKQPIHIWAVSRPETLEAIKTVTRSNYGAPLLLVVGCRPADAWVRRYDGKNGAEVDAAIVSTYLMLAAENEGLATLWVGSFDPALLREILPDAEEYELVAMINIGYPAADSKPSAMHDSRKPMDELVTRVD